MKVAVDISLYPLDADFIPPIKDVIDRLNAREGLEVWTNAMSTQLVGEFDTVMDALKAGDRHNVRTDSERRVRYEDVQ